MHSSISIMEEDHSNINRALAVVRALCLRLMNGAEVPDEDFRTLIDFIRNYADKHHHGKEEKFLFPVMVEKMGPVADKLVTHGMLVEHDLGRADILSLETALNEYQKNPLPELKLDILSYAMAYAHLSAEDFQAIDEKSEAFEKEQEEKGVQAHYLAALEHLEKKYLS